MKGRLIVVAGMVVLAVLGGVVVLGAMPAEATDELAPDEVVSRFYGWYLEACGEPGMRGNPLVERT